MARIRLATANDLPVIRSIARAAYAMYVARIGREPAPMVADFAAQISGGILHVVELDERVAGFVVYYPRNDHMHLENVAVAPSAHGQGLGTRLIEHVESSARDLGLDRVELYTNEKMTENIPYYLGRGYDEIGRWEEEAFSRIFFCKVL